MSDPASIELAALLERAYRLALWLQDCERPASDEPTAFSAFVASSELVDVLDEARARLVAITPAGTPTPARSSARPDR